MKEHIDINSDDFLQLDALFSNARQEELSLGLDDDNFTKIVANSLPTKPVRRARKGLSFDLIAMMLGVVVAYFYFDVSSLIAGVVNLVPETIVLSPMHALTALGLVSVMSLLAWWVVEKGRAL